MSKSKLILPALLTLAQATFVQTLLRKYETHYQIKSVKHKPLGREVLHEGEKYSIITRKISHVEDRHVYRSDIFVGNSKDGTVASFSIVVVRRENETVADVINQITFTSLLGISHQTFMYQQLGGLARTHQGYYYSGHSITFSSPKTTTMSLELQMPVLRVSKGGVEVTTFELYRQSKEVRETVCHRVLQNSAIWSMLKQYMVPKIVNPILDQTLPILMTHGMLIDMLGQLADQHIKDVQIDDDAQYRVFSGAVKTASMIQPLDYEVHVFLTFVNKKHSAVFRITGVNSRFTMSAIMQIDPVDGVMVITDAVYQEALKLLATLNQVPAMRPHEVTDEQRITLHTVYQGRADAPTVNDYVPYEVNRRPFLLSHPSFTLFDARLEHKPVFTSFLATPHKESLSIAAILTSDKTDVAKKSMERISLLLAEHQAESKTPVQTMAERMAADAQERLAAQEHSVGILRDAVTGKPLSPQEARYAGQTQPVMSEVQTGYATSTAACTEPVMMHHELRDSPPTAELVKVFGEQVEGDMLDRVRSVARGEVEPDVHSSLTNSVRAVEKQEEIDWAIPLLVGTKWPRALRMDITTLQSEGRAVYLAMLVPQFESFEKSIGYLAADYQAGGVRALVEAKKQDVTLPFAIGFSAGEVIAMLERTLQLELKTARDTGDASALEMTAQATVKRIEQTFETIVGQFNQAVRDGQAAVGK